MISENCSHFVGTKPIVDRTGNRFRSPWPFFAGLFVIIIFFSLPAIQGLWNLWHSDKNFEGFLLVPFMSAIVLYKRKCELGRCRPNPIKWILALVPVALATMFIASNDHFPRIAGLLLIATFLIIFLGILGYSNWKLFFGPLLFLILMIPPSEQLVTFTVIHLQKLFSAVTEIAFLAFSSRFLERHGLEFWFSGMDYPLTITSDCSGIRSLLGLIIISSFLSVFDRHSIVNSVLLIAAGIITALTLNSLRIIATMQMRMGGLQEYSIGPWHGLFGIFVFMIGYLMVSRLSRILKPARNHNKAR